MAIKLYYAPGACSLAPLVALEEAKAQYEPVRLVLANNDQRRSEYLAVNPRGRVPAIVSNGQVITENIAVLTYIARLFPAADLLPFNDNGLIGRAYELMSWFASSVHVWIAQVWRTERFTKDETVKKSLQVSAKENLLAAYTEMEAIFSGDWIVGDRFTVVDPYAYVFWRWGERLEFEMDGFKSWARHTQRVLDRPSVKSALGIESTPSATPQAAGALAR